MGLSKQNNFSKNIANTISNVINSKSFSINGLIFDSEEDYNIFKNLDNNINSLVVLVKNGIVDINTIFNHISLINVTETYPDAGDELDGLFRNATGLLMYEDTPDSIEYKVGCKFFDKIGIIEYEEDDGVV